jgi:hypothetical protein
MKKDTSGSAFPSHGSMGEIAHEGMTLRDYFAARAMQGLLADFAGASAVIKASSSATDPMLQSIAQLAYAHADAMLAERAK